MPTNRASNQTVDHSEVPNMDDAVSESFTKRILDTYFLDNDLWKALTYFNLLFAYVVIVALMMGREITYTYLIVYLVALFLLRKMRIARREWVRLSIAHSMPFFADSLANALSSGSSLTQAFLQGSLFLKGEMKEEFKRLLLKNMLGKNLGEVLKELDQKHPGTGLIYLISILNAYGELGVGIAPLLKSMSAVLTDKEKAEDKIGIVLASGSSYAKVSVVIFGLIFMALFYIMRDQLQILLSPDLRSVFLFLIGWAAVGILIVIRMTSMDFARNFALKPYIITFVRTGKMDFNDLLTYSGLKNSGIKPQMLYFIPPLVGFILAYTLSWFNSGILLIEGGFVLGGVLSWVFIRATLKWMVEDQLIKTVEIFPEFLQVFIIGLSTGLNNYLSFLFALNTIKGEAPTILTEELSYVRATIDCGGDYGKAWNQLAHRLPFETVVDFAKTMVMAPTHGESIANLIAQMTAGYQEKKLLLIEKKANTLSQIVIPVIVIAFTPLFIYVMFAPLLKKVQGLFH